MTEAEISEFEPINWLLVFSPRSTVWWVDRLPGRFRHVAATGFSAKTGTWVVYEATLTRTQVFVLPDDAWNRWIGARLNAGAAVLRIERQFGHWSNVRLGSWCVPAVKRLIGLRSGALRPDALWRDCLASGAEIVHEAPVLPAVSAGAGCPARG